MTATFYYRGTLDGHPVTGRVDGGKITGNPFVALRVQALVDGAAHVGQGPWSGTATLTDDTLARITVGAVVDLARFDPPLTAPPSTAPPDAVY